MPNYYEMDSRWKPHGITTKEDYENQVVIKGYFHEGVPEDVIKGFTTVEYLMAHAFYYWLLFDEAFAKGLFILEMAVKLRARQVGIDLEITKNDKGRPKRLVGIIDELCNAPHYDMLKAHLHRARKLRNTIAHPEQHSFLGPYSLNRNIRLFVVTLNQLFREEAWFVKQSALREKIRKTFKSWGGKPIVIEVGQEGHLFTSIQAIEVFEEHLMISLVPVLNVAKLAEKKEQPFPVSYFVKHVQIEKDNILGESIDGKSLVIFPTKDPIALKAAEASRIFLEENYSEEDLRRGKDYNTMVASWQLVDIEYEYQKHLYNKKRKSGN